MCLLNPFHVVSHFCILWMFVRVYCELNLWVLYSCPHFLGSPTSTQSHAREEGGCVYCVLQMLCFCCRFCRFLRGHHQSRTIVYIHFQASTVLHPRCSIVWSLEICDGLCILIVNGRHEQRPAFIACLSLWTHFPVPLFLFHRRKQSQHFVKFLVLNHWLLQALGSIPFPLRH